MKIEYTMQGDYGLPNLMLPEQREVEMRYYAQKRRDYLKEKSRPLYYSLLTSCRLTEHLAETQDRAEALETYLISELSREEGLTEQLKATDPMTWTRRMNNLRNRVREIVLEEVIRS